MELLSLIDTLTVDTLAPVYLFQGPERFLVERAIERIRELAVTGPMAAFNFERAKVPGTSGAQIADRCNQMPMLAKSRMVLVEDAEKLVAADWEALASYFQRPAPSTVLVLVAEKLEAKRGGVQQAAKKGWLFKAEVPREKAMGALLASRAKAHGVALSKGAAAALVQAVGTDCGALDDALQRLGLFAGVGNEISEEHVAQVVTTVRTQSVFDLVDAIGLRRTRQAVVLLEALLAQRQEPILINAMVARHLRQLLLARIHLHSGTDHLELPALLGLAPWLAKKVVDQSRSFRGAVLEAGLRRLAQADLELKSSRRPAALVIEEAILDLCFSG